jgi:hypothetical protein
LKGSKFLRLGSVWIGWEGVVEEKIPYLLSPMTGVEGFILCVTYLLEDLVGLGGLGTITVAHQLDDALAGINSLAEHGAQITFASPEDVLPNWFTSDEYQRICHELSGAAQFPTDSTEKDDRFGWHDW